MNSPKSSKVFVNSLLAGAAVVALSVSAAAAQAPEDQIIVTATKRPQTLQEVPVAVSVVDAETIERAQINDLIDLQASVPSLRVTQLQNSSQTNFVIRGFGNGANNPGIESAVGVFIDGVFRSRSASSILDLPTLERVEVLRGPQSTLFGKNVSVGAISISTRKPEYEVGGSVEVSYGNLNQVLAKGTITGPISDTVAFRISGSLNNRDGQYTNLVTGQDNINERDRWSVRGQLLWEPTDTMSWRLIGEYNRIDEVCCGAVQLVNGPATQLIGAPAPFGLGAVITPVQDLDAREVALDQEPSNLLIGRGGSLHGDWDLGPVQLTSITSYRQQIDENVTDVDFSGLDLATNPLDLDTRTFTQELRIAGETETGIGIFNWLAGGFYFDDDVSFDRDVVFGSEIRPFIDGLLAAAGSDVLTGIEGSSQLAFALTTDPATALFPTLGPIAPIPFFGAFQPGQGVFGEYELDNRSFSLFGQFDWEITDRLTITGGISYINDRKIASGLSTLTDAASNLDLTAAGQSFLAATALGTAIGTPFNPADPTAFFTAAGTLAATDPMTFAAAQAGALAFATDPANAALNPLLPLSAVQFFNPQVNFPQPGAPREAGNTLSDDGFSRDTDLSYTARIAYDVTDWLNVYFNYGTGFKASAVSLTSDSTPPQLLPDGTVFGRFASPEEVRAFEVGFKTAFDGGFINIALFDQEVSNFQSNIFTGTGFIIANADVQGVQGFEVDAAYSPIDPLYLTFGITYLDPEFESFPVAPCITLGLGAEIIPPECAAGAEFFDASGERPAGIHPVSLSTSATYTHDFANGAVGSARIEYLYESPTQVVDNVPRSIAEREVSLINANISYALENGFGINLWGRNLLDDDYLLSGFPTVAQSGSFSGYVNTQRTYGVSIRKDF
ncbi:MAG: TonB-dependent receptor [Pseudomonadota bacterium]